MTAALFVITVSSWYLLKKRHQLMAKRSIVVASVLGLVASLFTAFNGDESAYCIAKTQPMKLAAIEGLYEGETNAGLVVFGLHNPTKHVADAKQGVAMKIELPGLLSLLANRSFGSYVPGMKDLVYGNPEREILGSAQKMERGKKAIAALDAYRQAKKDGDAGAAETSLAEFNKYKEFLGYGYLQTPEEAVPPVGLNFYAFHIMVGLGIVFLVAFILFLKAAKNDALEEKTGLLGFGVILYFLAVIAGQCGWIVAEVGRQPWAIQDLLPVTVARTNLAAGAVQTTFFIFLALFAALLIAEISIMLKQIGNGPEEN